MNEVRVFKVHPENVDYTFLLENSLNIVQVDSHGVHVEGHPDALDRLATVYSATQADVPPPRTVQMVEASDVGTVDSVLGTVSVDSVTSETNEGE